MAGQPHDDGWETGGGGRRIPADVLPKHRAPRSRVRPALRHGLLGFLVAGGLATAAAAALGGCQQRAPAGLAAAGGNQTSAPTSRTSVSALPVDFTVSPADKATGVPLNADVTVSVQHGSLTLVSVADGAGHRLDGGMDADHHTWRSAEALQPGTTYHVVAEAEDDAGQAATFSSTFSTMQPSKVLGMRIAPLEGETVGVGMPIIIYFTAPVTDKAAVERHLSVEASMPVLGAWHWYGDTEVHYRPTVYWPVGDQVTLHADLAGVDAGRGVWGTENRTVHFTIGDSHISVVDARTHMMTVRINGQVARVIPVSTGRDKYPTTSGVHVVLEKAQKVIMDSATVGIPKGDPDYYYEVVYWNVRISWSGEFVHAAPWSVADQGRVNVSHGCVNVSPANAEWFYNLSQRGDIVQVVGTPRGLESGNGWTDWNMPWSQWVAGSALPANENPRLSDADVVAAEGDGFGYYSPTPGVSNNRHWVPPAPATRPATPTPSSTPSPTPSSHATGSAKPTPTVSAGSPTSSGSG